MSSISVWPLLSLDFSFEYWLNMLKAIFTLKEVEAITKKKKKSAICVALFLKEILPPSVLLSGLTRSQSAIKQEPMRTFCSALEIVSEIYLAYKSSFFFLCI